MEAPLYPEVGMGRHAYRERKSKGGAATLWRGNTWIVYVGSVSAGGSHVVCGNLDRMVCAWWNVDAMGPCYVIENTRDVEQELLATFDEMGWRLEGRRSVGDEVIHERAMVPWSGVSVMDEEEIDEIESVIKWTKVC